MGILRRAGRGWAAVLPAGLTVYLSFEAGGFFAQATGVAAALLAISLAAWALAAPRPLLGSSGLLAVCAAALAALTVWMLVSSAWSHAPGRAVLAFDRSLLYLLALLASATLLAARGGLAASVRVLTPAIVAVCACGLITRLAPDVWPISPNLANDRLSYPLTYWNALGLLAAIGTILSFHFASSGREPPALRVAGAVLTPIAATTLLFTFSRGAVAALVVGLLAYALLARPRSLVLGLATAGPACAAAVVAGLGADKLATLNPTGPVAESQGHHVARVLAVAAVLAGLGRLALLPLDARLERLRLPQPRPARARALLAGSVGLVVVVALALGAGHALSRQYDRFAHGNQIPATDFRARLLNPGNNGRLAHWRVAADSFRAHPVDGEGAGTYELQWAQGRRDQPIYVLNAHSLYMETLSELGLPGLIMLLVAILAVLGGLLVLMRRRDRALHGAVFAAGLCWALHAGVDWDWQMPAVSLWFFMLGGAALTALGREPVLTGAVRVAWRTRIVAVAAVALVVATPALAARSEDDLVTARRAFARGDCVRAIGKALDASDVLPARAEPFELIGYCDARLGHADLGVRAFESAVSRDPRNWRYRYGLAVANAAAGIDPRPAARQALLLNPLDPIARSGPVQFRGRGPASWRRASRGARIPIELISPGQVAGHGA